MYRKEIGQRSPLRVFERSIHGGLGCGNVGLVMSRAGMGKTAFLVAIAMDDLMGDRKVLHINTRDAAEKVREFYDEVFRDLAEHSGMENREEQFRKLERNRMIHTFVGGSFSLGRLRGALQYMAEHVDFVPSTIVMDGYPDWQTAEEEDLRAIQELAVRYECELWLSGLSHREGEQTDARGVPMRIARFDPFISVIVRLDPAADHVRLNLVKDHGNPDPAALQMELDPSTLLVRWR